eukprot:145812-Chlamydomonas_euryale.AAC.3
MARNLGSLPSSLCPLAPHPAARPPLRIALMRALLLPPCRPPVRRRGGGGESVGSCASAIGAPLCVGVGQEV